MIKVADGNGLTLSQIRGKTVVWAIGQADNSGSGATTLTTADQQTLTNFLNGGGKFILARMDALRRIESSTLVMDVLKLRVVSNVGGLAGGSALQFAATFNGSSDTAFASELYTLNSSFAWRDKHDAMLPANDASATPQGFYPSICGPWNYRSGTSMAAPYATGAAALAASTDPGLLSDPVCLKDRIMERGEPAPATAGKTVTGKIIDARTVSDVIAPTVSGVAPEDFSKDVPLEANGEATFSETMNPSTLTTSTFTLTKEGSGTLVAATVSYDPATNKATLDPETNLDSDATYVATIRGGSDKVKDVAGNPLDADKKWSLKRVDNTPPDAPTVDLAANSDTGASDTDGLTKDDMPTFDGTAEADSEVSIYDGTTLLGTAAASGTGDYSFTVADGLGDGMHRITARATDAAGNSSVASAYLDVRIDTAAPSAPVITDPADNA